MVGALCVPSYLWFEPDAAGEEVGPWCLAAALLCILIWGCSIARGAKAWLRSRQWLRGCERAGCEAQMAGGPALVVEGGAFALAGVLRARVIVPGEVVRTLSSAELYVALEHERAHLRSRDNLKRLLLLLAPDALPFFRGGLARLERAWKKFAEWAADDHAAGGDPQQALALASALVRVARLGAVAQPSALITSLVEGDLTERVERLLQPEAKGTADRWPLALLSLFALAMAGVAIRPGALVAVYGLLEKLIR
jgi:Zn-dependent protease with chaperone function